MRVVQNKKTRKKLTWYRIIFGFNPPFKVLVEPELLQAALKCKLYLKEHIPKLFQDRSYPLVTNCIVNELRNLGEDYSGASLVAKRFQRIQCEHLTPVSSKDCIASIIADPSQKYCVASNNDEIKAMVRNEGGIPLVFFSRNKLLLEGPSNASKQKAEKIAVESTKVKDSESKVIKEEQKSDVTSTETSQPRPKRKRAKGPNPLSTKKKRLNPSYCQCMLITKKMTHHKKRKKERERNQKRTLKM